MPGTITELLAAIAEYQATKITLSEEADIYGNVEAINAQSIATQTKPLLVHDAAGVGRTGAFLTLHIGLERYRIEAKIDLFTTIKHMRTQRMSMVQTHDQLEWAYVSILEAIENPSVALYENVGPARGASHGRTPQSLPPLPPKLTEKSHGPTAETSFMGVVAANPSAVNETSFMGATPDAGSPGYLNVAEADEGDHRDDFSESPDVENRSVVAHNDDEDFGLAKDGATCLI